MSLFESLSHRSMFFLSSHYKEDKGQGDIQSYMFNVSNPHSSFSYKLSHRNEEDDEDLSWDHSLWYRSTWIEEWARYSCTYSQDMSMCTLLYPLLSLSLC
jgi:hypothetical protein